MIAGGELATAIRGAALAELGPAGFARGCAVLASVTARLFAEVRGERLRLASDGRHTWAEDARGAVYDLQSAVPLVAARPAEGYRAAQLDGFAAKVLAELAESFAGLAHSPHIPRAHEAAGRIRRAALVEVARRADGETLQHLIFGMGRDGLHAVEAGRPELVEAWRAAARRVRVLEAAGLDEGRPFNEVWF